MGDLKAASLGKDPQVALSKAWNVVKRHQGIYSGGKVEVSKDGSLIGCMFGEDVVLVDAQSGQVVKVLSLGEGEGKEAIVTFAISPSCQEVVTASRNLMIRYWDWKQGRCVRGYKAHETPVLSMEFDSTGTLLCSGSSDRTAKVWDVPGGFCTHNFRGHTGIITLVRFHPNPRREVLFTAADDTTVRVWSLAKQSCLAVLRHHMSSVTGMGLSEDGSTLAMVGRDQILSVWDVESDAVPLLGSMPVYDTMEGLAVLTGEAAKALVPTYGEDAAPQHHQKSGKSRKRPLGGSLVREGVVAVAGGKGVIKAYHYRSKAGPFETGVSIKCVGEQTSPYPRGYSGLLGGSLPRPWVMAITSDHNLHFCDAFAPSMDQQRVIVGFNDEIIDVKYLPHGRVAVATNSPQVRILRLEDLSCSLQLEGPHTETVLSIDVSPDGRWVISGSKDRTVCLWDLGEDGSKAVCRMKFEGHTEAVGAVALMKRKHAYETGNAAGFSAGGDRTIKRWAFQRQQRKHGEADDEEVHVVSEATATVLGHDKDINALTVSPNDALLASASQDKTVKLWDAKDLSPRGVLKGHRRGVWSIDFSPIDRVAITGSADRTIKIWSLVDHSCLKTFEGHGASVLKTVCLKNGLQLLSVSSDGLMKLWTIKTQECDATFDEHSDRVWALAISPDGQEVVTGGGDSVLNVWSDVTQEVEEEELRKAEELVQKEQALANYIYRKDYKKAIELAFELNRPLRLWKILQEVMETPVAVQEDGEGGGSVLDEYVRDWNDEAVGKVLSYIRDWNTNAKHVMVAQTLLNSLFRLVPFDRLKRCCASKPAILDGLISYTDRHLARADRIMQSSYLVDFTLSSMHTLFGEDAEAIEEQLQQEQQEQQRMRAAAAQSKPEPPRRIEQLLSSSDEEDEEEEEPVGHSKKKAAKAQQSSSDDDDAEGGEEDEEDKGDDMEEEEEEEEEPQPKKASKKGGKKQQAKPQAPAAKGKGGKPAEKGQKQQAPPADKGKKKQQQQKPVKGKEQAAPVAAAKGSGQKRKAADEEGEKEAGQKQQRGGAKSSPQPPRKSKRQKGKGAAS